MTLSELKHEKTNCNIFQIIIFVCSCSYIHRSGRVIFFPINAPGMGRFQLLNLGGLGYGLELRFWGVIAIIVSLTLTITLIKTLTII